MSDSKNILHLAYLRDEFHRALAEEASISPDGFIRIAKEDLPIGEVFKNASPTTYDVAYDEWLSARAQERMELTNSFISSENMKGRFSKLKNAFDKGVLRIFVGAGMSTPSGYKGWTELLWQIQKETRVNEEDLQQLFDEGLYEEAAELLQKDLLPHEFSERLENAFYPKGELFGAVQMLPYYYDGVVITTNFDEVLEKSYSCCERSFNSVLTGTETKELSRIIAEGAGKRILIKLHGHYNRANKRILTKSEYDKHYGNDGMEQCIDNISQSSLLFLGCSLTGDRTVKALESLMDKKGHENMPKHFAFMEYPGDSCYVERARTLAKANIFPIWYNRDECSHDEAIESLLYKLFEDRI